MGPSYGRTDASCWGGTTVAHEHMHNLGGVQLSAPNTSGGYHCVDEWDLMCYSDLPYEPAIRIVCPSAAHDRLFDCNHDDYYSTRPPAGSYLATHRNAANSRFLIASSPGTGLRGEYFDNRDFTALKVTRTDPVVNFDWGQGSPDPSMGADSFSVRWSGTVEAEFSQTYTFFTRSDDGVRLWVNNQLLIDKWIDQGGNEWSGAVTLTAGTKYAVRMELYENTGGALAQLSWSSPSTPKQVIPQARLYRAV